MAYTITGRKSGSVRFEPDTIGNIQSEAVSMSSKVTSNPIENGADINDHVVKDPVKFSISGTIIGGQQGQQTLQTMRDPPRHRNLHRARPHRKPRHHKPLFRLRGQEREGLHLQGVLPTGQHLLLGGSRGRGDADDDAAGHREAYELLDSPDQENQQRRAQDHSVRDHFPAAPTPPM